MPDTLKCPACGDPLEPHWHDGLRAAGVWTCPNCVEDGRRPPMDDDHGRTGEETISLNYLVRDGRILRGTEALIAAKGLRMEAEMEHRFADRCLLEALKDAGMQHTADTYMDGSEGRRVVVRMITDAELREWEALCQKATKGPWELEDSDGIHAIPTDRMIVSYAEDCAFIEEADARFCAAARTAMPKLIAEVRRLRDETDDAHLTDTQRGMLAALKEAQGLVRSTGAEVRGEFTRDYDRPFFPDPVVMGQRVRLTLDIGIGTLARAVRKGANGGAR